MTMPNRTHAGTEQGPRSVPRRGLARHGERYPVWAPTVAVGLAGRLRSDARATRAAAMPLAAALNAPLLHGFSPVRSLRARTSPHAAALLTAPQGAATGYRPPRSTTEVFVDEYHGGAGSAVGGCAPAATYAAPRSAGLRGLPIALRRWAGHRLFEHRAQAAGASPMLAARGRVSAAALATRAPQGIRSKAEGAASERRRIPAHGFARSVVTNRERQP